MRTLIHSVILCKGANLTTKLSFINDAVIQIKDNLIVYAGKKIEAPEFEADKVIDGKGYLALPGLCNMHTHVSMDIMRSLGSDLSLEDWLNKAIFPVERQLTDDAVKAGTDLAMLELLRFGITSINDMYMRTDVIAKSVDETGMRAMLSYGIVDFDESCNDFPPGVEFAEKWHNGANGRIKVAMAPHSVSTTTKPVLQQIQKVTSELKLCVHAHISETQYDHNISKERYGKTPVQLFDSLGLLDGQATLAHCVWLEDEDIEILARRGTVIVHNPISNLKLASGMAPIHKMLQAGCKVAIGTDGVASNNNLNLWEEMKLMPLLQKGLELDPTIVSPSQTWAATTSAGTKALGFDNLGMLDSGYLADLILVDIYTPHMWPHRDLQDHLIYSTQGSDVKLTMINGKVLYNDGEYLTLDKKLVMNRAKKESEALFERAEKAKQ